MTEYDFSPDAYERYMDNQNRVSSWVSSQSSHTRRYASPFVPTAYRSPTPPRDTAKSPTRSSSHSRSSSVTLTVPTPTRQSAVRSHSTPHVSRRFDTEPRPASRLQTIPSNRIIAPQPTHPVIPTSSNIIVVPNQSHEHHHHSSRRSSDKSPSSSRSHHHHHRHRRTSSTSHSHNVPVSTEYDSSGRKYIQIEPDYRNRVVRIPPPRQGEQYVIIPPPGGRVEVVHPQKYHQSEYREVDRERERGRKETTFLRRLFGGFGDGSRTSSSRTMSRSGRRRVGSY